MDFVESIIEGFGENLSLNKFGLALGATLAVAIIGLAVKPLRSYIIRQTGRLNSFFKARNSLNRINNAVAGDGLWKTTPIKKPATYSDFFAAPFPILTVANLKGGVGKTTTAVNLGAFFAVERDERVLLIDLDYQGSMSSMLLSRDHRLPETGELSKSSKVVEGSITSRNLKDFATPVRHDQMKKAYAIPAYYDLAAIENREMIHWLSGKKTADVRYTLAELLHVPKEQRQFDRVIIDAPPRLTTGTIQALCASTHVLIPSVLDTLSGEAVGSFVRELVERKELLWPHLKIVGVSGQLVSTNISKWRDEQPDDEFDANEMIMKLNASEREGLAHIKAALGKLKEQYGDKMPTVRLLPPDTFIAKRAPIAESAGTSVAFLDISNDLKAMFRKLGREVEIRMDPDEIY